MLKVLSKTEFCTEELQVDDGFKETLYVNAGSNIAKYEFEKKPCEVEGLGNIYKVHNRKNEEKFIYQEAKVIEFHNVTATIGDYVGYFLDYFKFPNILDYMSFGLSGIYDTAFLAARNSYIFSGEKYRSAQVGITNLLTDNNRKWKDAANQNLQLTDYISPEQLMNLIVGNIYLQWIYFLLQICGYVGGVAFLSHILFASCKDRITCPSITLKTFKTVTKVETIKTRRVSSDVLEWDDNADTDEEAPTVVMEENERIPRKRPSHGYPPPPYYLV